MINVTLFINGIGYLGYEIKGHAGYADYGNDIVCAGVSMAGQLTLSQLNLFNVKYNHKVSNGYLSIITKEYNYSASLLIEALHQALMDIQSQYPKHISVTVIKVDNEKGNLSTR